MKKKSLSRLNKKIYVDYKFLPPSLIFFKDELMKPSEIKEIIAITSSKHKANEYKTNAPEKPISKIY